jgi:catechol-2,3-dioxygenase
MNIKTLELLTSNLRAEKDFYASILELPTKLTSSGLHIQAGTTEILFTQAPADFAGAYHFAFNIPSNQYQAAKEWVTSRIPILKDSSGKEDFHFDTWNSDSLYFLDAAGNVLEFIARHGLNNPIDGDFDSSRILNVSEIGLPSENVLALADELCSNLGLSIYKQEPNETFTPVGDENGLFILPIQNRIWMPDSGVPAKMLPVRVSGEGWEVRGLPYEIQFAQKL